MSVAAAVNLVVTPYDVLLLDLDGVLYVGADPVPYAASTLKTCRQELAKRVCFITNNASRPAHAVSDALIAVGVDAEPTDVVTSAQAAAGLLASQFPSGSPILVVGGEGLVDALGGVGLRAVWADSDEPVAVVQGFHPDVNWRMLAQAAAALHRGVPWVATNRDMTIPTPLGIAPGNGTLIAALETATGAAPTVVGKPEPPLVEEALRRTGGTRGLVIGDRMDTDIQAGFATGLDTALVLTGVNNALDYCFAPPNQRPTYIFRDMRGLLAAPIVAERMPDGWRCGGWEVSGGEGNLTLRSAGADALDGVRAIAAAMWEMDDAGQTPAESSVALVTDLCAQV